jgi:3-isopropylmalate dehydrogenase
MPFKIAVLAGDGIGPEVMTEALKCLKVIGDIYGFEYETEEALIGGTAYDEIGTPFPDATLELCKNADAVLLGAVGGLKWEELDYSLRPERALLGLRSELELYANLRPAKIFPALADSSSLKREVIDGVDILVVRELVGGIYFGEPKGCEPLPGGGERGFNTLVYSTPEIERIARVGFEAALKRNGKLMSVDKANVLESSDLWRRTVTALAGEYTDVELSHMYVDNCAMQLIRDPKQFDVIVTGNMFGDILSDEAAMLTGSIGMLPSASIGGRIGLYEPVHGSAPDIAGQGKANPCATILSVAMMMQYSFGMIKEAKAIEEAVTVALDGDARTPDIATGGKTVISTEQMGDLIAENIKKAAG